MPWGCSKAVIPKPESLEELGENRGSWASSVGTNLIDGQGELKSALNNLPRDPDAPRKEHQPLHWAGSGKREAAWPLLGGRGLNANKVLSAPAPHGKVNTDTWLLK